MMTTRINSSHILAQNKTEEYILNKVYFGFYAYLSFFTKLTWFKIYFRQLGTICVNLGSSSLLENRAQTEPQFYALFALHFN